MPAIARVADLLCTTRPRSCGHREPAAAMDRRPPHRPFETRRPRAGRSLQRLLVASWAALAVLLAPAAAEAGITIRNLDTSGPPTIRVTVLTGTPSVRAPTGLRGRRRGRRSHRGQPRPREEHRARRRSLPVDARPLAHRRCRGSPALHRARQGRRPVRDPRFCIRDNRSRGLRGRRRLRRSTRRSHRRPAVRHDPVRRRRPSVPDACGHRNRRSGTRAGHRRAGDDEQRDPQERDPGRAQGARRRLPGRDRVDLLRAGAFEASGLRAPAAHTTAPAPAPP